MHRLKKHLPDILLTLIAAAVAAGLILAFIVTVPRHIDKLEGKTAERHNIYQGD